MTIAGTRWGLMGQSAADPLTLAWSTARWVSRPGVVVQTARQMQDYFLSIGLCLFKGKDVGRPENGWMVTAAIVYSRNTWYFSGKTLREVERWWKKQVAILEAQDQALRMMLRWYATLPTEQLDAIYVWADSLVLGAPVLLTVNGVPSCLTKLYAARQGLQQYLCPRPLAWPVSEQWPPPLPAFIGKRGWRSKAARLHSISHKRSGCIRRDLLSRRIARLAKRACKERLRCLPEAQTPAIPKRRL